MSKNKMMTLRWILILMAAALLAACAPAAPATQQPTPSATRPVLPAAATPTRGPGCTVVTRKGTPAPTQPLPVQAPNAGDHRLGDRAGQVQIIAYCDYQSPGCAYVFPVLERLADKYPQDVDIVYRHYPLITLYDKSALAAQAAEAAGEQDKFWEMNNLLYARQQEWAGLSPEDFQDWLAQRAQDLNLDTERFEKDLTSSENEAAIKDAYQQNADLGMTGTPFLLVNGEAYEGPPSFGDLDAIVSLNRLEARQFSDCPPLTIDPARQYLAVLHTKKGAITLELFPDKAPLAVNNFVFLAKEGWFDGVTFHRVLPGFMAQTGDPTGTGYGGPGYAFDNEISDLRFDGPGVVGMANAGPGSNGSQFFITYAAAPHLDGGFTIFGHLVEGMDVLNQLTPRDPSKSGDLPPGDEIIRVEIIEK